MAKRSSNRTEKPAARSIKSPSATASLRRVLKKRSQAALVDALVELAEENSQILRRLEAKFLVMPPPSDLVAATRQAIADATAFDPRDINRNFAYDYEAYATVQRNLQQLIEQNQLKVAMELALALMEKGSYQIEMSDEGIMTEDVEEALEVVIDALASGALPAAEVIAWCDEMRRRDRVGLVCKRQLSALRNAFT
jgi:hypothetical protein